MLEDSKTGSRNSEAAAIREVGDKIYSAIRGLALTLIIIFLAYSCSSSIQNDRIEHQLSGINYEVQRLGNEIDSGNFDLGTVNNQMVRIGESLDILANQDFSRDGIYGIKFQLKEIKEHLLKVRHQKPSKK